MSAGAFSHVTAQIIVFLYVLVYLKPRRMFLRARPLKTDIKWYNMKLNARRMYVNFELPTTNESRCHYKIPSYFTKANKLDNSFQSSALDTI